SFVQAEDGIRDATVTGVQTCALPISLVQSLHWTQPLRPGRFHAGRLAQRLHARALAWALRPVSWAIDGLKARWPLAQGLLEAPLTPTLMAAHLPHLLAHATLRPRYD